MVEGQKAVVARVTGRVQGVAYRYWARGEAQALGVSGWIRNERDGSVTALIAGRQAAVDAMVARLADGPTHARVAGVVVEDADNPEPHSEFRITG